MADRKVFHDSVVPIPVESGPSPNGLVVAKAADQHRNEKMTVHFSLSLPEAAERDLEAKVAAGGTVSADALQRDYGAKKSDADGLMAWLKSEGYDVVHASPDLTSVYATAPVDKIEKSLQVDMVWVTHEGLTYTAARNAP